MALRKASAYSKMYARPYTRKSTKKAHNFIKTVPSQKIVRFKLGDIPKGEAGKFEFIIKLKTLDNVTIRDNALEAARQYITKQLDTLLPGQYYFRVMIYPHHILRENKMLTGAGADRMQTGMQLSFGKTIGRAAMIKAGGEIFQVHVSTLKATQIVRKILNIIRAKLPGSKTIELIENK